jgi:hypothetical protein
MFGEVESTEQEDVGKKRSKKHKVASGKKGARKKKASHHKKRHGHKKPVAKV